MASTPRKKPGTGAVPGGGHSVSGGSGQNIQVTSTS